MIDRTISYNRETKDFDCFVDGRYVGSRANYRDGDILCDQVAFDLIQDGDLATALELDGDPPGDNPLGDEEGDECPDEYHAQPIAA